MNITINPNTKNYNNSSFRIEKKNNKPNFNGLYGSITNAMAKHYTVNLYTSPIAKFLVSKTEKLDSVINSMQILGSMIVSGMYMLQTLRNHKLDDDRRKTLATNQFLTFVAATFGGKFVDSHLDSSWEKFTKSFAKRQLSDPEQIKSLEAGVDVQKAISEKKFGATAKYVKDVLKNKKLASTLEGMGILKKLLIFTMMYRFIVPVAVTPIANIIGDKYIELRKQKADKNLNTKV